MFLDCFDILMLKINFLKNYLDIFLNEKYFEKHLLIKNQTNTK
jgi:hypothetical protein